MPAHVSLGGNDTFSASQQESSVSAPSVVLMLYAVEYIWPSLHDFDVTSDKIDFIVPHSFGQQVVVHSM